MNRARISSYSEETNYHWLNFALRFYAWFHAHCDCHVSLSVGWSTESRQQDIIGTYVKDQQRKYSAQFNPLSPELNPSPQRCLKRFFTEDFAA
jgi:hypothetical protein